MADIEQQRPYPEHLLQHVKDDEGRSARDASLVERPVQAVIPNVVRDGRRQVGWRYSPR